MNHDFFLIFTILEIALKSLLNVKQFNKEQSKQWSKTGQP